MNENNIVKPAAPLELFSLGLVSKEAAVEALGLRDYSELLLALGAAGLPLPAISEKEMRGQVRTFCRVWKNS